MSQAIASGRPEVANSGMISLAPLVRIGGADGEGCAADSGGNDAVATVTWPTALAKSIRLEALMASPSGLQSSDGPTLTGVLLLLTKLVMAMVLAKMDGVVGCCSDNLIL